MKKGGVLNHRLSEVIATMGHTDFLVLADAGLPVPKGVERIDLAVSAGIPALLDVARAVAGELQVERLIVATELTGRNPALADAIAGLFPGATVDRVPHEDFKALTTKARAVVRTGECTPYANVILVSGVTF
ncbi:MAG TPA: D-ribose pyranase [Thermomicrobiales bacterium]